MVKNSIKKFLSMIGTTTLLASPIIAMGGGLLSNNQSLNNNTLNNKTNSNIDTADYTEITCDNWTPSTSGSDTLWTCSTTNGNIVLQVNSLGELTVNSGTDILKIDPSTTNTTYNLNLSSISGVASLGNYCFRYCDSLSWITLPDGMTSLGRYCFSQCTSLSQITLPKSVTSLSEGCFLYTEKLKRINIMTNNDNFVVGYESLFVGTSHQIYFENENLYNKYKLLDGTDGWDQAACGDPATSPVFFTKYCYYYEHDGSAIRKTINNGESADNLLIGSFKTDDSGYVSNDGLTVKISYWNSQKGTTSDGINLSLVRDDSDRTGSTYNVLASWDSSKFDGINDNITFGVTVENSSGIIVAGSIIDSIGYFEYNWEIVSNDPDQPVNPDDPSTNSDDLWSKFIWLWIALIVVAVIAIIGTSIAIAKSKKKHKIKNLDKDLEKMMK